MLEASHELLQQLGRLEPLPASDLELRLLEQEETPGPSGPVEDASKIESLLGL